MIGYLLLGIILTGALLIILEWWARAETADAKRALMVAALGISGLIALFFIARGQWLIGVLPVALTGSRLFSAARRALWLSSLFGGAKKAFDQRGGADDTGGQQQRPASGSDLSESEALQILGLPDDATRDDIQTAYKKLMEQVHPDRGGNDWLAERLNAARDRLLKS